ncbi:putative transporter SEO1 [Wickerhamomyces ciferrii]|uniref:Transporter SEO1 n=1 Tax=Wickerhamomyces ciferrii (strain ATCC 14091 / BCRC 22168 / CBS 111 / JCM 3599 / NBRC 0793 / NRRL Y-1031 F-60-10) TaxID=1206466 RepID=K0KVI2_WICCF|nr:putative transporter SEO1 [Wickerhamomyces ciferrii]CCH45469.1 putative transporter SEO1 [Wickerhamomyces ciferrii]
MSLLTPFKRLKWGFIPVERHVEDDLHTELQETDSAKDSKISKDPIDTTEALIHNDEEDGETQLEYRDEANRPWWKFFDEYEYRQNKAKRSKHKWYKWFNESDTPAERKLIIKLDITLTFYLMMQYWVKYLDQTNLNNAYVSGMKEDLGFKGNDLVNTQAMFTVGSIVFQIPFMYALYKLPMNYILPALDILWSIFTLASYRVETVAQIKVMRFFVGLFESGAYVSGQFLFASFYTSDEIVRRSTIFYIGQYLGVATSGLLQGKLFSSFHMIHGLEGWRWMFIFDAVISFAVGIIGFYSLPGTPEHCYSIWLTDDEVKLSRSRMNKNNTSGTIDYSKKFFDKSIWKQILTSWQVYALSLWNIFLWNNNNGTSGAYLLWLKSLGRFSIPKVNQLSAVSPAVGIIWLLLTGCYADLFHSRWQAIFISQIFNFIGNVILASWNVPEPAKWFAWMLQYTGWAAAPTCYSWAGDILRRDLQKRSIVMVIINILAQTFSAWISVIVWATSEQPRFLKGYSWTAAAAFSLVVWTFVILYFYKKDERKFAKENGIILYNSKTGENYPLPDKQA